MKGYAWPFGKRRRGEGAMEEVERREWNLSTSRLQVSLERRRMTRKRMERRGK